MNGKGIFFISIIFFIFNLLIWKYNYFFVIFSFVNLKELSITKMDKKNMKGNGKMTKKMEMVFRLLFYHN
jgi:hypothetical protein